jgi:hypothetical protein
MLTEWPDAHSHLGLMICRPTPLTVSDFADDLLMLLFDRSKKNPK